MSFTMNRTPGFDWNEDGFEDDPDVSTQVSPASTTPPLSPSSSPPQSEVDDMETHSIAAFSDHEPELDTAAPPVDISMEPKHELSKPAYLRFYNDDDEDDFDAEACANQYIEPLTVEELGPLQHSHNNEPAYEMVGPSGRLCINQDVAPSTLNEAAIDDELATDDEPAHKIIRPSARLWNEDEDDIRNEDVYSRQHPVVAFATSEEFVPLQSAADQDPEYEANQEPKYDVSTPMPSTYSSIFDDDEEWSEEACKNRFVPPPSLDELGPLQRPMNNEPNMEVLHPALPLDLQYYDTTAAIYEGEVQAETAIADFPVCVSDVERREMAIFDELSSEEKYNSRSFPQIYYPPQIPRPGTHHRNISIALIGPIYERIRPEGEMDAWKEHKHWSYRPPHLRHEVVAGSLLRHEVLADEIDTDPIMPAEVSLHYAVAKEADTDVVQTNWIAIAKEAGIDVVEDEPPIAMATDRDGDVTMLDCETDVSADDDPELQCDTNITIQTPMHDGLLILAPAPMSYIRPNLNFLCPPELEDESPTLADKDQPKEVVVTEVPVPTTEESTSISDVPISISDVSIPISEEHVPTTEQFVPTTEEPVLITEELVSNIEENIDIGGFLGEQLFELNITLSVNLPPPSLFSQDKSPEKMLALEKPIHVEPSSMEILVEHYATPIVNMRLRPIPADRFPEETVIMEEPAHVSGFSEQYLFEQKSTPLVNLPSRPISADEHREQDMEMVNLEEPADVGDFSDSHLFEQESTTPIIRLPIIRVSGYSGEQYFTRNPTPCVKIPTRQVPSHVGGRSEECLVIPEEPTDVGGCSEAYLFEQAFTPFIKLPPRTIPTTMELIEENDVSPVVVVPKVRIVCYKDLYHDTNNIQKQPFKAVDHGDTTSPDDSHSESASPPESRPTSPESFDNDEATKTEDQLILVVGQSETNTSVVANPDEQNTVGNALKWTTSSPSEDGDDEAVANNNDHSSYVESTSSFDYDLPNEENDEDLSFSPVRSVPSYDFSDMVAGLGIQFNEATSSKNAEIPYAEGYRVCNLDPQRLPLLFDISSITAMGVDNDRTPTKPKAIAGIVRNESASIDNEQEWEDNDPIPTKPKVIAGTPTPESAAIKGEDNWEDNDETPTKPEAITRHFVHESAPIEDEHNEIDTPTKLRARATTTADEIDLSQNNPVDDDDDLDDLGGEDPYEKYVGMSIEEFLAAIKTDNESGAIEAEDESATIEADNNNVTTKSDYKTVTMEAENDNDELAVYAKVLVLCTGPMKIEVAPIVTQDHYTTTNPLSKEFLTLVRADIPESSKALVLYTGALKEDVAVIDNSGATESDKHIVTIEAEDETGAIDPNNEIGTIEAFSKDDELQSVNANALVLYTGAMKVEVAIMDKLNECTTTNPLHKKITFPVRANNENITFQADDENDELESMDAKAPVLYTGAKKVEIAPIDKQNERTTTNPLHKKMIVPVHYTIHRSQVIFTPKGLLCMSRTDRSPVTPKVIPVNSAHGEMALKQSPEPTQGSTEEPASWTDWTWKAAVLAIPVAITGGIWLARRKR
jgi:hypothetical protein